MNQYKLPDGTLVEIKTFDFGPKGYYYRYSQDNGMTFSPKWVLIKTETNITHIKEEVELFQDVNEMLDYWR